MLLALARDAGFELTDVQLEAVSGGNWNCWDIAGLHGRLREVQRRVDARVLEAQEALGPGGVQPALAAIPTRPHDRFRRKGANASGTAA